ncbi:MAG TPA: hypothetical protein VMH89_09605 [Candidatus Acidoferrum sp.]|nr:hypothetical protein [Candidatus Acidoferrum sp.]
MIANGRFSIRFLTLAVGCFALSASALAQTNAESSATAPDPAFVARANEILAHSRKQIDQFFEQTSNVVCTEDVSQTIVGKNNKAVYKEESVFEYQMQANSRNGTFRLAETREPKKAAFRDPYKTLLITNGFASMLLILHENYESSYVFQPVGEEEIDGRVALNIRFSSVPGTSSPAAVQLRGRNYPLQLKGELWIDEDNGAIVKLISSLEGNLEDLGLKELRSEIHYSLVEFHSPEESYWMPASATIDVETPKQHWRNVHRFTEYKRFRATIQVDMGAKP